MGCAVSARHASLYPIWLSRSWREDLPHRSRVISVRRPSLYVGPSGERRKSDCCFRRLTRPILNLQGQIFFFWRSRCAAQVNCSFLTCLSVGQRWGRLSESQPAGRDTERSPGSSLTWYPFKADDLRFFPLCIMMAMRLVGRDSFDASRRSAHGGAPLPQNRCWGDLFGVGKTRAGSGSLVPRARRKQRMSRLGLLAQGTNPPRGRPELSLEL